MKDLRVTKRGSAGDRAVAIGGFLVVLLPGFFGAEPEQRATTPDGHAIMATAGGKAPAAASCTAPQ